MASLYWVGGTATWDATAGTKWASTSGGAGGQPVPTVADDVFFTSSSTGTCTLSSSSTCRSLNCTGFTGTISHPAATTITIGDGTAGASNVALLLSSGMTYTLGNASTSALSLASTSATTQTITTNTKVLGNTTVGGTGSSYQLADAINLGNAATLTVSAGTFDANGQNVNVGLFASSNSNTRTITMGAGAWSLNGTGTVWNFGTVTNLTMTTSSATINITDTSSTGKTFTSLSGQTYAALNVTGGGTGTLTINRSFVVTTGTIGAPKSIIWSASATRTFTNLNLNSSAGNVITFTSATPATAYTISCANRITADYLSLTDCTGSGAGIPFYAGTHSTNVSGNTNWLFTSVTPDGGFLGLL